MCSANQGADETETEEEPGAVKEVKAPEERRGEAGGISKGPHA